MVFLFIYFFFLLNASYKFLCRWVFLPAFLWHLYINKEFKQIKIIQKSEYSQYEMLEKKIISIWGFFKVW